MLFDDEYIANMLDIVSVLFDGSFVSGTLFGSQLVTWFRALFSSVENQFLSGLSVVPALFVRNYRCAV